MTQPPRAIEATGLVKRYGEVSAVAGIDLIVETGSVVAVLGPNGAGKSTTLEMLIGLRRPTAGQVRIFGSAPERAKAQFGAMLQESLAPEALTVAESVALVASYYPRPLPVAEVLERAELTTKATSRVGQLSGGQRQRLSFALAIVGDPRLLLLDEPTSALDVDARLRFWDQVRELAGRGRTILLSTHNMAEAQTLAQRVVLVNRGAIVADGTPGEVAALTGVQTMRLSTDAPLSDLAALPSVREASVDPSDGRVRLLSTAPEEALRVLFATGRQVRNLTVADADLESAFVALVHADTHAAASTSTVQEQK
jgi:ABC-2 type transport system ATP-binding protein